MTKSFTTLQPIVNFQRGGRLADQSVRTLRILPGGAGFGVVKRGKVVPVTPSGDGRVAVCDLSAGVSFKKDDCRPAKLADLGLPTKAAAKATAKALGATPERSPAQKAATVKMLKAALAKAIAEGDGERAAKMQAALAKAEANLSQAAKPAKAGKAALPTGDVDALVAALKASDVDLVALITKLAQ